MSSKNDLRSAEPARDRDDRPWSLAARLTVWYAISAFTLVLVSTGILYWALISNLNREDDQFLADQVQILRDLLSKRPEYMQAITQEVEWESASRQYSRVYIRLLDAHGGTLAETPDMSSLLPSAVFPAPVAIEASTIHGKDVTSPDGTPFRLIASQIVGDSRTKATMVEIGVERTRMRALVAQFRTALIAVLAVAFLGCSLGAYAIARRGLRPLTDIAATVRRVRSTTLHERVRTTDFPAELSVLAETFNEMLDRLQESFDRLSRFSADIAHELRTPVNNLRGEAEVTLGKTRSLDEYREALGSCLEESVRLSRMIDGLLLMARAETPQSEIPREPVDMAAELTTLREFYDAVATEAGVDIELRTEPNLRVSANRPLLQRAIGNLIENAISHTPSGGEVCIACARQNGRVRIEVSDTGCGIPAQDVPRVFDRFYRVERDRSSASGGSGLGLAIVRSIAHLHGGDVELQSSVGRGTSAVISLPCS